MTLKGNQPGNYQPPSGEPVTQVGQQAFDTQTVFNDPLAATINDAHGDPAIYIRGPSDGANYRLVRISDQAELERFGSLAAATARANGMILAGEVD